MTEDRPAADGKENKEQKKVSVVILLPRDET